MKTLTLFLLMIPILGSAQPDTITWKKGMRYIFSGQMYIENGQSNIGGSVEGLYFVKPKVAVGPTLAYVPYNTSLQEAMLNVGIQTLWTPKTQGRLVPFVSFASGIGFLEQADIGGNVDISTYSRIFIQPKIGVADIGPSGLGLVLTLGYIRQGLDIDFTNFEQQLSIDYNRYVLSLGITF